MTYETLKNRRYVLEYDESAEIAESQIEFLLQKTWSVTPSKNNFMPYTVHVLGPKHKKYKELVFLNCASNEGLIDNVKDPLSLRYSKNPPKYSNILNCSYLLIFTMRLEDKPNEYQQMLINRGHKYEAVKNETLNDIYSSTSLEVGLFADALSGMCLEKEIDVSFTGCFHRDLSYWKNIPFVNRKPILLMTLGKAKSYYRENVHEDNMINKDYRPDYNRIVNFVKFEE
jgi:hypothetical protein